MKAETLSIGIVTFRQRASLVRKLVGRIRDRVPENVHIILVVNNNNNEEMYDDYRKDMLELSAAYKNVYPIFCPQMMSLSKLWNTIIIFSKTEYNLILGDDVYYGDGPIFESILQFINQSGQELFTINHGFSHFVISKTMLDRLNYFEERLFCLGFEDADMHYKHMKVFGSEIPTIHIPTLVNMATYQHKSDNMEIFVDNKPRVNKEIFTTVLYRETDKDDPEGVVAPMSPLPNPPNIKKVGGEYRQYPYEMFVSKNRHNIQRFDKIVFL